MILRYLSRHQHDVNKLYDWCYVANFEDVRVPKVLKLPCGIGIQFRQDIEKLMTKLVTAIPLAFDNEIYFSRAEKLKTSLHKSKKVNWKASLAPQKSGE